jgi:hypothetical protein
MGSPSTEPNEVPSPQKKPELIPPDEQPTRTWPEKKPEILPAKEPDRIDPPKEIPSPPRNITKRYQSP